MLNVVVLMGRLVADPQMRQTPQGVSVASFTIAVDRNYARQGEQRQADFIDIVVWRQTAEFVCKYFTKGSPITVEGSIQTRKYQAKDGTNRTAFEVVANNVGFVPRTNNTGTGGGGSYAAPAAPQEYSRPAAVQEAAPSYSAGSADDFAVIDDNEDLPF